jgi:hypothetical protein
VNAKIERYVKELRHTATTAGFNYDIWWVYKGSRTRPKYTKTMNRYGLYFQTAIHAHFVALLVELYRLYETRSDTFNIPSLLRLLKTEAQVPSATLRSLDMRYAEAKPLWVKVNILRNKAFGHQSTAHTTAEIFKEAAATPNDLRDLVKKTKKLLNEITLAVARTTHAFNLEAKEDTLRLLEDLKAHGEA